MAANNITASHIYSKTDAICVYVVFFLLEQDKVPIADMNYGFLNRVLYEFRTSGPGPFDPDETPGWGKQTWIDWSKCNFRFLIVQ